MAHGQLGLRHVLRHGATPKLVGFMPLPWRALRYGAALRAGAADKHALRPGDTGLHDAPELRGASHASASALAAADVWGLGVVLVSLLCGQPPMLMGASGERLAAGGVPVHHVELPDAMHSAPAELTALARAMLSIHPADRPSTEAVSGALAARALAELERPPGVPPEASAPAALSAPEPPIASAAHGGAHAAAVLAQAGRSQWHSKVVAPSVETDSAATPSSEVAMSAPAVDEARDSPHTSPPTARAPGTDGRKPCTRSPPANPTGAPQGAIWRLEPLPPRASNPGGPTGTLFADGWLTRSGSSSSLASVSMRSASPDDPAARAESSSPVGFGGPSRGRPAAKLSTTSNEKQLAQTQTLAFRRLQPR